MMRVVQTSVDQKQTLITSANLSYHGQQGNIEIGTLIESKQVAKQIEDVFTKLIFSKVFNEWKCCRIESNNTKRSI